MKRWQIVTLVIIFIGFGTAVFAFGPPFGGIPPFAGNSGSRGPFAGSNIYPGPMTPLGPGSFRSGFGPGFSGGFGPLQYLNLSEEQLNKMGTLRDPYLQDTRDLRYAISQEQLEVWKLITDPKADDAALFAKQKEMSTLRQKLLDRMAQIPIEMRKILTPEQIQKLDQMGPAGRAYGPMGFAMMGRGMRGGAFMRSGIW